MGTGTLGDLSVEKDPRNEFLRPSGSHSMADGHALMVILEIGGPSFTACCQWGLAEGRCSQTGLAQCGEGIKSQHFDVCHVPSPCPRKAGPRVEAAAIGLSLGA